MIAHLRLVAVAGAGLMLVGLTGCVERGRGGVDVGVGVSTGGPAYVEDDPYDGEIYASEAPPDYYPADAPVGVAPGPDYLWVNGIWIWSGGSYHWHAGHWGHMPHAGARWVAPHWTHGDRGWERGRGHWE